MATAACETRSAARAPAWAEMTNAGLPVPPGFTISTDVCSLYYTSEGKIPSAVETEISRNIKKLETAAGTTLGSTNNPLLVSVRSGSKFSMPGMMDTILNLGLNDAAVEGLKVRTSNGRFAFDSYRRFMQMFGSVVLEIPKGVFEHEFDAVKRENGVSLDTDLDEQALREVVQRYKRVVRDKTKRRVSTGAARAVEDGARCGLSLVDESSCSGIPPHLRHSRITSARR